MQTPLSYVMDLTKSTAKEISELTGINVTLLSKFKNGQRKLQYSSRYPADLSNYFLQCRAETVGHVVSDMLAENDSQLKGADSQKLREALALYLCTMPEESLSQSLPTVEIFENTNELKKSLDEFTQMVLTAPAGMVSVVHDFPDMGLSTSFLDFSLPYLEQMKNHGCTIQILDCCAAPKTYMSIYNWMEFYFSDQIQMYSDTEHAHLHRMIFILDDTCALVILSNDVGQKMFHSTFYKDSGSASFFRRSAELSMQTTSKLIEKIPFTSISDFLHTLDRLLAPDLTTFLINPVMMYKTMNTELIERVLEENGISPERRKDAFETNRFTAYLRTKCPYRQIYDLTAMTRIATMESTVDEELSAVYGKPIYISRQILHEHIKYLNSLHMPEKYSLLFVPFENLHLLHGNISYVVQQDELFLAWDAARSDYRIYSRDRSIVQASYTYMEEIWKSIPAAYTDPEWQRKQIEKLIDLSRE